MCLISLTINSIGPSPSQVKRAKKEKTPPTFLDDDFNFTDTILMGLDSIDADLNRPDDITNTFDFDM
jgi:hypothetical protein